MRDLLTHIADDKSPRRAELLARLHGDRPDTGHAVPAVAATSTAGGPWPATPVQEQLWLLGRLRDCGAAYCVPFAMVIDGPVDARRLALAVARALGRHEGLCTRFHEVDGQLVQEPRPEPLVPEAGPPVEEFDSMAADRVVWEEARRPFDLAAGPLVRVRLLRESPTRHRLVLVAHHAVTDGWSTGVLAREIAKAYADEPLPRSGPSWSGHARSDRSADPASVAHWVRSLRDVDLERAGVPVGPGEPSSEAGTLRFCRQASGRTPGEAARALGVSAFALFLAAFQMGVGDVAGTRTAVTGVPLLNRAGPGREGLVGPLSNTLPVRVDLSADLQETLDAVATAVRQALSAQDAPVPLIVRELPAMTRSGASNPLFRQLFNMGNLPGVDGGIDLAEGVVLHPVGVPNGTVRVGMELTLEETGETATGRLEFDRALHSPERAASLLDAFLTRLDDICALA